MQMIQKNDSPMVYIIDDDLAVRRSIAALMGEAELNCIAYETGNDFIENYEDTGAACVVMDLRMPGISGLRLLEKLRDASIHHPTIMISGYGEITSVVEAFRLGAVDFFEKPVNGSILLDHIQKAIEKDRIQRDKRLEHDQINTKLQLLSKRERRVLNDLIKGKANKEIAWELSLSEKTIAAHRANLLHKMGYDCLSVLIVDLTKCGLLSDNP